MFLEAIEMALHGQARRLAKDIAAALGKPEEPLLKRIETDKIGLRVFEEAGLLEDDIEDIRCKYHVPYAPNSRLITCCNEPVVWVSTAGARRDRCIHHIALKQLPSLLPVITIVTIDDEKYFVDMETGSTYNELGEIIGRYGADDNSITMFEIEGEDS